MKRLLLAVILVGGLCAAWFLLAPSNGETTSETPPIVEQPSTPVNRIQRPRIRTTARERSVVAQNETQSLSPLEVDPEVAQLKQKIDNLISPQTDFRQKQALWKQLRDGAKSDDAIKELEQRAADNPTAPEIAATLGQAYISKIQVAQDSRDPAILGLKADQSFDTALKLDPSNWEAGFFKAASMSYWPVELHKSDEVVQRFDDLIKQQETLPPQPHFAESYTWLGAQYQKYGQSDYARQVWQRGAALFPADETLKKKLAGQP